MLYNRIIYIGIIQDKKQNIVGGFATANARNLSEYKKRKLTVEILPYPVLKEKSFISCLRYFGEWILFVFKCYRSAKNCKKQSQTTLIHITPFYKYFIVVENIILGIFSIYNKNILIDIRAGSFITYYNRYGKLYRVIVKSFLKKAKLITVEGYIYKQFFHKLLDQNTPIHYYPNYVQDENILSEPRADNCKNLKLIYFGRITRSKGIEIIIQAHKLLKEEFDVETLIIGSSGSEYLEFLKGITANENIKLLPPLEKKEINKYLLKSCFFLFPTIHTGEGQSNALLEAMGYGLVPIVSDNGFNRDVVYDKGLVLSVDAQGKDYAQLIKSIVSNEKWLDLSEKSRLRIINNFSNSVVSENFYNFINKK